MPCFYLYQFYNDLRFEFDKYKRNNNDLQLIFFNNLIFDLFYFTHNKTYNNIIININNNAKNINNIIKDNLFCVSIPLLFFCLIKIVKLTLIKLKYSIEQIIFYM